MYVSSYSYYNNNDEKVSEGAFKIWTMTQSHIQVLLQPTLTLHNDHIVKVSQVCKGQY